MQAELPIEAIQQAVLIWYRSNRRHDLPWRNLDKLGIDVPYGVMVSEIMLQQTQVRRVIPKYLAFLATFPTIQDLAQAPTAQVLSLWSGLGYNRRALMLHKVAQAIVTRFCSELPDILNALVALPGIGPYTAAAILAFGFNQSVPVIDTNIQRFYELFFFGYTIPSPVELKELAEMFTPPNQSRAWHSALMDIMTQVRSARSPKEQQQKLLEILQLTPTWELPKLDAAPLFRPKQSEFRHSKRYFRGRIMAYLGQQKTFQANVTELEYLMQEYNLPLEYDLKSLLIELKHDGLVEFTEPLTSESIVSLP